MTSQKETSIWIGPTKCDEKRFSREKDTENVWNIIKPMLEGNNFMPSTYIITSLPLDLLRESLNCYQNGAYLAVCSMCRACVEALLYLSTKLKPIDKLNASEIRVEENYIRETRKTFLKNALDDKLIDDADKKIIEKIWDTGDFAMHIHQKKDQNAIDLINRISKESDDPYYTSKGWSDREEALKAISDTATLVLKITKKLNASVQNI